MLVDRQTGKEVTPEQLEACQARAQKILSSPYSSPELIAWAMEVPGVDVLAIWESSREQAQGKRKGAQCS